MPAKIIDGRKIAEEMLAGTKKELKKLKARGITPKLVVVQVGNDPASTKYVEMKHKKCAELGIESQIKKLSDTISYEKFIGEIEALNANKSVTGILVQVPLPKQLSHKQVFETIALEKDVDGFHPFNHGKNLLGKEGIQPATPKGIMKLIESTEEKLQGKNAVVIGRSNIVGKPIVLMLINAGCTVTVCNSNTKDISEFTKNADIIVSAVGKANIVTEDMVKKGAIIIDVGTSKHPDGKLGGDVDFEKVKEKAGWITPVPGGVGPMTIASLMDNTVKAAVKMNE